MVTVKEGEGGINRESSTEIYILPYVKQWESALWHRELKLVLCDNVEKWDGEGGGERFKRGDICMPGAVSCWCIAETIPIL